MNLDNQKETKSSEVAKKSYDVNDYKSHSELEKGLATTHEQVNDTFVEGTIDGIMEDVDGKDIPLKRKGLNKGSV
ncbi:YozQ family protein [Terrilactibacillus laevilacticus]|uniref:YozQ family protein n=1 Tax=Terrilactibacillus laevilacticus TaxID=1380157 RepID=A0ABW5PNN7_9BACI|nr:YozQ family protein [Terrilactibacillus laevilacticus]